MLRNPQNRREESNKLTEETLQSHNQNYGALSRRSSEDRSSNNSSNNSNENVISSISIQNILRNIQQENKYASLRLTFWTAEGLACAYVFFGSLEDLSTYLQQLGFKIGYNPAFMVYAEVSTIISNGPFNGVVNISTIEAFLKNVSFFRGKSHPAVKTLYAVFGIPVQLAAVTIASLGFYMQLPKKILTLAASSLQIIPNSVAGTDGAVTDFLVPTYDIAKTGVQIVRGTYKDAVKYSNELKQILSNLSIEKYDEIHNKLAQLTSDGTDLNDHGSDAGLKILLQRIAKRQEKLVPQATGKKVLRTFFPPMPVNESSTIDSQQSLSLAKYVVELTNQEKQPNLNRFHKLLLSCVITALQFYSLYGVMFLGNEAIKQAFASTPLDGIHKLYMPHLVLTGMLQAFSYALINTDVLTNPIRLADRFSGHHYNKMLFGIITVISLAALVVSWSGALQSLLKALLDPELPENLELAILSDEQAVYANTAAVVLSNGSAVFFKLFIKLQSLISSGVFDNKDMQKAILSKAIVEELSGVIDDVVNAPQALDHLKNHLDKTTGLHAPNLSQSQGFSGP